MASYQLELTRPGFRQEILILIILGTKSVGAQLLDDENANEDDDNMMTLKKKVLQILMK